MEEYYWPETGSYENLEQDARESWQDTAKALSEGTQIAGKVIGRQPFGVFLRIDGHPNAIGLAEMRLVRSSDLTRERLLACFGESQRERAFL
ncbi:S1 domain-containing protein [Salininema proteolyticum]|uniref:Uncharacterized protein n=1 Tax=Salininema proteolyticum TaxID=1607685 RepID=A0ABV8U464_9ACTN